MRIREEEHDRSFQTITVAELRDALDKLDDEALIAFASDYGDYHHTQQLHRLRGEVDEVPVTKSAYSVSGFAVLDEEENEPLYYYAALYPHGLAVDVETGRTERTVYAFTSLAERSQWVQQRGENSASPNWRGPISEESLTAEEREAMGFDDVPGADETQYVWVIR